MTTPLCQNCGDQPMYQVVHLDPDPCADRPDGCTPVGCARCMPTIVVPCPVCGLYLPGPSAVGEA